MESKATTEISKENEDDRVTQPWNSTRPVNFYPTQTLAGVKSLCDGTSGSKDS